ncbi:syntaxin-52-like [Andrographis paniculata]|uniref:syntaxin-52-like n=1 Tax=Andrographis paniculata TaxID=175694 RepID=UPI0021E8D707|nr:syntaxin-52-like [Andrographis paniculata]XP_051150116.1 syntaxin-52-like [Andrographis paniculata]
MVDSGDVWMREYNEAVKLSDDISNMMSERSSLPATSSESQRSTSTLRRKITILGTRLDNLEFRLSKPSGKPSLTPKNLKYREDLVADLRSTVKQMASELNASNLGNRDRLLSPDVATESKPDDARNRAAGLDNVEIFGLQRQIMKEQDEDFDKLQDTVMKTKDIALAINEELDLHTRLIFDLDEGVEVTGSKLQQAKRKLAILNKRMKGGCSCASLLLSVVAIVVLIVVAYMLIKYL